MSCLVRGGARVGRRPAEAGDVRYRPPWPSRRPLPAVLTVMVCVPAVLAAALRVPVVLTIGGDARWR